MKVEKVKDICSIQTGKLDVNEGSPDGKYPFYTCAIKPLKCDTYSFDNESIILPGNGANVGEVLYHTGKIDAYQRTYILNDFKSDPKYTYYYFKNYWKYQVTGKQFGSATNYIRYDNIADFTIPLPPIDIQKKIAAVLDRADRLRRKRQEAIDKLDELVQSVFLDMFGDPVTNPKGWEVGTIRDIVSEVKYGTSKKADTIGDYPILRMNNITYDGHWDFSDLKYINITDNEKAKYMVTKGDILFNRTNSKELVGKNAVYRMDDSMVYAGYLIRIRPNQKANSEYISSYLNSSHGKAVLFKMCKNIVGMANINAQELQNISIHIPPIDLQNRYAEILNSILKNRDDLSSNSKYLDNLFNSLLQRAFKGDLKFNDKAFNDIEEPA